ncbi:hypothetical protein LR48_Vigan11g156900 [Vigna angularis]|uniref:Homologous recombination OB-fold protein OB-fold domain-containing protein n=1 Tax=Phaseolus angularis TaxID=3914 RepID=A0A0L9VTZ1_PHAAN|nr:hypothetical protein LR48_Vigan11g156900 [Vigna angularis]
MKTLVAQVGSWFFLAGVALAMVVKFDVSWWLRNKATLVVALMVVDNMVRCSWIIMDAWEDLVYDDDVLESFLKKCNASASLIPGPVDNVQAAFLNRTKTEQPKSTQKFARDVAQATYERDFNSNAWKWAQMFIEHHATMKASLHKKVLQDPEFGDNIGVGSVMLLNLVQSFSAFRKNYYLNIVHRNVVKVFPTEICPPTIELVKDTSKSVIRLPMWAENNVNVDDILRKLVPSSNQPSTSKEPKKH